MNSSPNRSVPTLLRLAEHIALKAVSLSGSVVDLGGEKGAEYLSYISGTFETTTVNLDEQDPDIFHDLEKPLPIVDNSYDHALLINVLEHIFNYAQLLDESVRIVRPGGSLVIIVPFLFPVHPSPHDYHRFTSEALRKELEQRGLEGISVTPLGSGVFAARYVLLDRLMPVPVRTVSFWIARGMVLLADQLFAAFARKLGKKYLPSDYALGYLATARKSYE